MSEVAPLESLWEVAGEGEDLPLPAELRRFYGPLRFPPRQNRPYVISNFVSTLDGVVSLNVPGQSGGGPISGEFQQDRMVMGLLRAVAEAVVVRLALCGPSATTFGLPTMCGPSWLRHTLPFGTRSARRDRR